MAFFSKLTSLVSDVKSSISAVVTENKSQFQAEELKIEDDKRKLAAKQSLKVYPLWTVMNEDQTILEGELKTRILKLSMDVNTFKEDPPVPTAFRFDFNRSAQFAEQALKDDSNLNVARYRMVRPKGVKEDQFWRNYFYRVWMIREDIGVHPLPLGPAENDMEEMTSGVPEAVTPAAVVVMTKRPAPSTTKKTTSTSLPVAAAVTTTSGAKTAAGAKKGVVVVKPDNTTINDSISEADRLNNEMNDLLGEDFVNVGHNDAVEPAAAKKMATTPTAAAATPAAPAPAATTAVPASRSSETATSATTPSPSPSSSTSSASSSSSTNTATPAAPPTTTPVPVAVVAVTPPAAALAVVAAAVPPSPSTNTPAAVAVAPVAAKVAAAPAAAAVKPKIAVVPLASSSSSDLPELDDIDSLLAEASESDPTDDTPHTGDSRPITDDDLTRDLDGDLP